MIHCRKGQNEMLHILRPYAEELPGGVFHCFTGNQQEAAQLLAFPRFMLGIGGVLTFKSSHLREDLLPLFRYLVSYWKQTAPIWLLCPIAESETRAPLWH